MMMTQMKSSTAQRKMKVLMGTHKNQMMMLTIARMT
jgi:hypothetical protein